MSTDQIWIIEHDLEDHDIVQMIWKDLRLPHELVLFDRAETAFDRLSQAEKAPFIIICEVNLPGISGFELRQKLLETHSKKFKSVPFIFWSSHATETLITRAYDLSAHGFFVKEGSFAELKETFSTIIHYWLKSRMPAKTEKTV